MLRKKIHGEKFYFLDKWYSKLNSFNKLDLFYLIFIRFRFRLENVDVDLLIELSTVSGGPDDPLYNVLKRREDNKGNRKIWGDIEKGE